MENVNDYLVSLAGGDEGGRERKILEMTSVLDDNM